MELGPYLGSPLACCRPGVDASPILSLDGRVFIAGYKYSQKVLIKRCCYCSTKLEMLEVSASWLFHAAMNILWERKYLVSDSFYSAATHRAGNLRDLAKIKITACPPVPLLPFQNPPEPHLTEVSGSLGEWPHL